MAQQASHLALASQSEVRMVVQELDQQARDIAESSDFQHMREHVAVLARSVATMPVLLRQEVERSVMAGPLWQRSAVLALQWEQAVMKAVDVEARRPAYLALPSSLVVFERDPQFLLARPLGRVWYRECQYSGIEGLTEREHRPLHPSMREVAEFVDGEIRPVDRRVAASVPLAYRVGLVVGFLSGLAISQPTEARNGLFVLARLVAPLLVKSELAPTGSRATGRAAARRKSLPAPRK